MAVDLFIIIEKVIYAREQAKHFKSLSSTI